MTTGIEEALKLIPAGTNGCVRSCGLVQNIIREEAEHREGIPRPAICNHTFIYWGSGKNEIVEANKGRVRKDVITKFFIPGITVYLFANTKLTVQQAQIGKAYSYGTVGRDYDFKEIGQFGWAWLRKYIPFLKKDFVRDDPGRDVCSRNTWDTDRIMELPIVTEDDNGLISPSRLLYYFEGFGWKDNWRCVGIWKDKQFLMGDYFDS